MRRRPTVGTARRQAAENPEGSHRCLHSEPDQATSVPSVLQSVLIQATDPQLADKRRDASRFQRHQLRVEMEGDLSNPE